MKEANNSLNERAGEQDKLYFGVVGALEHNDRVAEGEFTKELGKNLHVFA